MHLWTLVLAMLQARKRAVNGRSRLKLVLAIRLCKHLIQLQMTVQVQTCNDWSVRQNPVDL